MTEPLLRRTVSRSTFLKGAAATGLAGLAMSSQRAAAAAQPHDDGLQVAAYYFPQWHVDPRNEGWHGAGWTEWRLVQDATPRFRGHDQPKVPLWGYQDESDPARHRRVHLRLVLV